MNSFTEELFGCKMALTQRHKFSVCEKKHAVNTSGLYVSSAMMYSVPQEATNLFRSQRLMHCRAVAQFTASPESCTADVGFSLPFADFFLALIYPTSLHCLAMEIFLYTWLGSHCFLNMFAMSLLHSMVLYIMSDLKIEIFFRFWNSYFIF